VYNNVYYINAWVGSTNLPTRLSATLIDSGYTASAFIYKRLVEKLYKKYRIEPFDLSRLKPITTFDGRPARTIR